MRFNSPCKDCPDRAVGCHGKDETGRWRCKEWGEYEEAKVYGNYNPLPGYITDKQRVIKHRLHRSRRK